MQHFPSGRAELAVKVIRLESKRFPQAVWTGVPFQVHTPACLSVHSIMAWCNHLWTPIASIWPALVWDWGCSVTDDAEDAEELVESDDSEPDTKSTCDVNAWGVVSIQCNTDRVIGAKHFLKRSITTSGSDAGIWAPRCCGVIGRQPEITWWIKRRCSSSWPLTSSREYKETLCWIGLWWPWSRLISSVMIPWWHSWEAHDKTVAFMPCIEYEPASIELVRELRFHGIVKKYLNQCSADGYDKGWKGWTSTPSWNWGITKSKSPSDCAARMESHSRMNRLIRVAVPTDRNPDALAPQGWPLEQGLVRQLMPRISVVEQTTELTVTRWRSEYLRPDQIIRRNPPMIMSSYCGTFACNMRRSHWVTTYSGSGNDSRRSPGTFDFIHPWIKGESKNDHVGMSACLRHHCNDFNRVEPFMPEFLEPPCSTSKMVAAEMAAKRRPESWHQDKNFEMQDKYLCSVDAANASKMTLANWLNWAWLPMSAKTLESVPKAVKIWTYKFTKKVIELGVLVLIRVEADVGPVPSWDIFARLSPGAGGWWS